MSGQHRMRRLQAALRNAHEARTHTGRIKTLRAVVGQLQREQPPAIDDELRKLAAEGPTSREMEQAMNAMEAGFLNSVQTVIGKADQLNAYYFETGDPDAFQRDLDRLKAVTPADVRRVVGRYLLGPRAIIGVVPEGQLEKGAVRREVTP